MATAEEEHKATDVLIKSHYDQATRHIGKGITCDENNDKEQANTYYNKALRSIDVGLAMKISNSSPNAERSRQLHEKLQKLKVQVKKRLEALNTDVKERGKPPARPPPPIHVNSQKKIPHSYIPTVTNNEQGSVQSWEDARELFSVGNSVNMFFVSKEGNVTTLHQPQTLRALQLVNESSDSSSPTVFLQCGSWVFPLVPGRSPVLKTEDRTFMIPDINLDGEETSKGQLTEGKFPTVGLVFSSDVSEGQVKRFERILKCYSDYRHYTPECSSQENDRAERIVPTAPPAEQPETMTPESEDTRTALVPVGDESLTPSSDEQHSTWGAKVSRGIEVGAVLISWGLSKGATIGGNLINQGSEKLRGKIKPNEESAKIDPKIEDNVRQIKTATGVACQVSSAIVSAVSALTYQLGKQLAPIIVEQGSKLLPQSAKQNSSDGKGHIQEVMKVAVGGVQGIAVVHEGLTNAWKILYSSLSQATVTTVDHKYGEQAGRITGDAMGAVANAVEAYHNVNNLGYKAIAKKAVKDTGKECLYDANKKIS
ncbi:spartin-like [Dendronephthya gigantea]|uniref:spartin-like n=1 Tax=Dendronephthya gigantea TaxID=151771 RepID=UPI00106A4656|nr:spartin-like [Dendronephthya gigantea]